MTSTIRSFFAFWLAVCSASAQAVCPNWGEVSQLAARSEKYLLLRTESGELHEIPAHRIQIINTVKNKIDTSAGIYSRLLLCADKEFNAFAATVSGQNVTGITIGAVSKIMDDESAYAAILGHETAHLTLKHQQKDAAMSVGLQFLWVLAATALEMKTQEELGIIGIGVDIADLGVAAASSAYSRSQEIDADKLGLKYAINAGYQPAGAVRLHQLYMPSASSFLSTHPSSEARLNTIYMTIANVEMDRAAARAGTEPATGYTPVTSLAAAEGVVLKSVPRYGYFIATRLALKEPILGQRVKIKQADGSFAYAQIARVVDGYFSATLPGVTHALEGSSVEY